MQQTSCRTHAGHDAELVLPDARAEGGRRLVTLRADRVTIERRVGGVAMRVALPVGSFHGVCVALRSRSDGRVHYAMELRHRDPELCVTLAEALDDRDIWADWRRWASYFGVPALVERSGGTVEDPVQAPCRAAPFGRAAKPRRARFVTRRHAQAPMPATIHREDEIIART